MKATRGKGPAPAEDFAAAGTLVDGFLDAIEAQEMEITFGIGKEAISALPAYGKVVGHPAQLNFGDALSYAGVKTYQVPLLYKGADFLETDLGQFAIPMHFLAEGSGLSQRPLPDSFATSGAARRSA